MSQMTATARPLRAPRRGPAPTPLRVIPARITHTGNGAFATICIALLIAGLIALLLLNTALAQGSLALGDLQRESAHLSDTASNLQEEIDRASATGALARSASEIGMVRMNTRGYIDLAKGTVSGDPEPATKNNAFPIVTSPTPPAVTAKVKKVLASATKASKAAGADANAGAQAADKAAKAKPEQAATPTLPGAAAGTVPTPTLGTTPGASTEQPTGQPTGTAPSGPTGQAE
ncbi:hypothetical protein [Terrabacter sp. MAHUQ-38]|jgi:hypothetical protein|uniref:hypothetical protein n=1 Tax=unclassified Terrabacter TaxID=2630222 RepID=UPI00165E5E33|nr:hypothetical protein [Terrabacter sp. MAHUQ-38]MBC9823124.1 hypothetical protein [Terrabacter sp. MAHUQ-38]